MSPYRTISPIEAPSLALANMSRSTRASRARSNLFAGSRARAICGWRSSLRRDGRYLLRLQSELLRGGSTTIEIKNVPSLEFPVSGHDTGSIGSGFGAPRQGGRRAHHGIDIFAPRRTEVLATSKARVRRVDEWKLGGKCARSRRRAGGHRECSGHPEPAARPLSSNGGTESEKGSCPPGKKLSLFRLSDGLYTFDENTTARDVDWRAGRVGRQTEEIQVDPPIGCRLERELDLGALPARDREGVGASR